MTYDREPFTKDLFPEFHRLSEAHWKETRRFRDVEFNPAWEAWLYAEKFGALRLYVVRDGELCISDEDSRKIYGSSNRRIIGYAAVVIQPSFHTQRIEAQTVAIYITPSARGFAQDFIAWYTGELQKEGVEFLFHHTRELDHMSALLPRLGHEPLERSWVKRLTAE